MQIIIKQGSLVVAAAGGGREYIGDHRYRSETHVTDPHSSS